MAFGNIRENQKGKPQNCLKWLLLKFFLKNYFYFLEREREKMSRGGTRGRAEGGREKQAPH